ncbi:hypothetical protein [Streptomyces sp. NPDC048172]|uniref:hypothetical protein n=1 Tax=Streptomyces sp. NPDC048172 TaxID=3365505 RepID=UPI0037156839
MDNGTVVYASEFVRPTDEAVALWELAPREHDLPRLKGNCPTCGHECRIAPSAQVVHGGAPSAGDDAPVPSLPVMILCNCRKLHERPEGVRAGCGRYWLARLTRDPGTGTYALGIETNLDLLPAAEALHDAQAGQNARIQAMAEKWTGAITALCGLLSVAGIAASRQTTAGLGTGAKWGVAAVLAVSLALAASAVVLGMRAVQPLPRVLEFKDAEDLTAFHEERQGYARRAARQLVSAIRLAFGALGAALVLMALVWFLPRQGGA